MELTEIIKLYFKHLKAANLEKILKLFATDAMIDSPVYGDMTAEAFYTQLFEDTKKSTVKVYKVYDQCEELSVAAHFKYKWDKNDGTTKTFDCIDIFNFNKFMKIESLTIIYEQPKEVLLLDLK